MSSIGQSVINNLSFLNKITKAKSEKTRKKYLKLASEEELLAIIECAYNILKGRITLNSRQRGRILPYIEIVRQVSRSRTPHGVKTTLQKGEGISLLPALLAPIIIEAIKYLNG